LKISVSKYILPGKMKKINISSNSVFSRGKNPRGNRVASGLPILRLKFEAMID
jgi:hypothetical protein